MLLPLLAFVFGVGARRRRRALALIAAHGADAIDRRLEEVTLGARARAETPAAPAVS